MSSAQFTPDMGVVITRVADRHWHAVEDDLVVGRGEYSRRPDGRVFLSIDAWHGSVFDRLAEAMLVDLPGPLYTVVDEADTDLRQCWARAGFATRRREWEYRVPTDPRITGLDSVLPPPGVTILAAGSADQALLREVDRAIRDEVEARVGWQEMPAEVLPRPVGDAARDTPRDTVVDPSKYAVAAGAGRYLGLIRVVTMTRRPRIGLIAVRAEHQRRGIGRALLAHTLGALHDRAITDASAEVNESNAAAAALLAGIGARRTGSNLELVRTTRR